MGGWGQPPNGSPLGPYNVFSQVEYSRKKLIIHGKV